MKLIFIDIYCDVGDIDRYVVEENSKGISPQPLLAARPIS